jgi:SnoaL-like domain
MNEDAKAIVAKYLDVWNETNPARRAAAVAALFAEDCEYTDPLATARGVSAVDRMLQGVQEQLPGFNFSLVGKVDSHHEQVRFTWQAAPEGATEPVIVGSDVMLLAAGRILRVYGFLDKVPG